MITGELKNRIDSLWEIFWTGGLTNPLEVIEQMTYLMIWMMPIIFGRKKVRCWERHLKAFLKMKLP